MEYEKDCSLTDEAVPVDFTICMNEQAVISVSEYTRLKCKSREYNVGNGKNMNRNGSTTAQNQKILRAGEILTRKKHNTSRFPTACQQSFRKKISKKHKRTCERMQPNRPIEPEKTTML